MTERDVEDLAINRDGEVYLDARGDLATVTGTAAFEQELMLRVSGRYLDIAGTVDRGTIRDLLEVEARRVADEMDQLDRVVDIRIVYPNDAINTVEVTVIYDTGDEFTFREEG